MSASKQREEETIPIFEENLENDFNIFPNFLDDSFLHQKVHSPKPGDEPPSPSIFSALANANNNEELSELFYLVNPINGALEEAKPNVKEAVEKEFNFEESLFEIPAKRQKLSHYEEALLRNFSQDMKKEQKLLAEEHEMKMKLWDLQMQSSQQEHALKMAILKEQLEKVQQEKRNLEVPQNLKYLSKFKSGPI